MFEWAASKHDRTWVLAPWHSSDPLSHQLGLQKPVPLATQGLQLQVVLDKSGLPNYIN